MDHRKSQGIIAVVPHIGVEDQLDRWILAETSMDPNGHGKN